MDKWIEINVNAIINNLLEVKTLLGNRARLIAVLKANAYGHGAIETAQILSSHGVDFFAMSFTSEAIMLREAGITGDILVLTPVVDETDLVAASKMGITITLTSLSEFTLLVRTINLLNNPVRIHLKIDSGLGRFGLNGQEVMAICQEAATIPKIQIDGIYTHFADPTSPEYTTQQFNKFIAITEELSEAGFKINLRHVANSAVFLRSPEMYLEAVRIGTLLSGQHPVGKFPIHLNLQDPFLFKSRIISLRTLPAGSYLGYYRTYKLKRQAQIAVIPVGFVDGLMVEVSNKPIDFIDLVKKIVKIILTFLDMRQGTQYMQINDSKFPIRGKVFMQMAMVEIPHHYQLQLGDEVVVPVRKTLSANDVPRKYVHVDARQAVVSEQH